MLADDRAMVKDIGVKNFKDQIKVHKSIVQLFDTCTNKKE